MASNSVPDLSNEGDPADDDPYHRERYQLQADGTFRFDNVDGIQQNEMNGGSWRFRLRVVNENGRELGRSAEAVVDWNH